MPLEFAETRGILILFRLQSCHNQGSAGRQTATVGGRAAATWQFAPRRHRRRRAESMHGVKPIY